MQEYVIWLLPYNSGIVQSKIMEYDDHCVLMPTLSDPNYIDSFITWAKAVITPDTKIIFALNYTAFSVQDIIAINKRLPERNIGVAVWTIDNLNVYRQYLPYVQGILSNKYNVKSVLLQQGG